MSLLGGLSKERNSLTRSVSRSRTRTLTMSVAAPIVTRCSSGIIASNRELSVRLNRAVANVQGRVLGLPSARPDQMRVSAENQCGIGGYRTVCFRRDARRQPDLESVPIVTSPYGEWGEINFFLNC